MIMIWGWLAAAGKLCRKEKQHPLLLKQVVKESYRNRT